MKNTLDKLKKQRALRSALSPLFRFRGNLYLDRSHASDSILTSPRASSFLQQVAQTFALACAELRPLFIASERVSSVEGGMKNGQTSKKICFQEREKIQRRKGPKMGLTCVLSRSTWYRDKNKNVNKYFKMNISVFWTYETFSRASARTGQKYFPVIFSHPLLVWHLIDFIPPLLWFSCSPISSPFLHTALLKANMPSAQTKTCLLFTLAFSPQTLARSRVRP